MDVDGRNPFKNPDTVIVLDKAAGYVKYKEYNSIDSSSCTEEYFLKHSQIIN